MKTLITGSAGFIGSHLASFLLNRGDTVVGLDSINSYYDPQLKLDRLKKQGILKEKIKYNEIIEADNYKFIQLNLEDKSNLLNLFERENFDVVCNLAAQAGVRYSLENPDAYINSNIIGFLNILECCKTCPVKNLVYASSSSVYGNNSNLPFSEKDSVDTPISLYAATKKSNELFAYTYSHLFGINTTGLRFFTVYGPWGRPDMALFLFTKSILDNKPIDVYNFGGMLRDFTYVDDIIQGIVHVIDKPQKYKIYNIGNNSPVKLLDFIKTIEDVLGKSVIKNMLPLQKGDVPETYADVSLLMNDFRYKPTTPIRDGIEKFIKWYKEYYAK